MLSKNNLFMITLCTAVAVPSPETNIVGPKFAGTTTSVNALPGVSSAAASGAGSAAGSRLPSPETGGTLGSDITPYQSDIQTSSPDFEGSLATGSGTAFSGRVRDIGSDRFNLGANQPQFGQAGSSFASGRGLGIASDVNPSFGQAGGSYASGRGLGIAGRVGDLETSGADLSGIGAGTGIRDQVTGGYNPYSPFADFCYGNSNCIGGYPKGYFQGGGAGVGVGAFQGLGGVRERVPQTQGSYGSGYGSGYSSSYGGGSRGEQERVPEGGSAFASGYGSAYAS